MSKTPWTPGPWHTVKRQDEDEASLVCFEDGIIADCSSFTTGRPIGEDAANARLIAAAPEMADFLLVAREYIEHTANGEMDKGVSGIAKRDLARLDEILSAIRGDQ